MDKNNIKSTLTEYLIPLNHKFMFQQIQHLQLDKYVKKLDSVTTAQLCIFAQLMNVESYANISLKVKTSKKLQKIIDLKSISTSQLSRKLRDMDTAFLESVFKNLVQMLFERVGVNKAGKKLGNIHHDLVLLNEVPLGGFQEKQSRHQASLAICLWLGGVISR